ncbi:MAG: adenylosuccinate synthase [Clostridiales bacterium]|jgi:adenylosuccinate synthase|nr:adenylosuccinate synthase [Clostridiales bacterium]
MLTAVVGVNWGDEGKGRMVDLLSSDYDVIARYQGGNNAGHTVVNEKGRFILNLLPSGILRDGAVNVMGPGMVVDLEHLVGEIDGLRASGIKITPENLKISDKATVCLPYHRLLDCLEEDRLKDKKFGSTRRGIAPVYGDKYMKKTVRMGDILTPAALKERLFSLVEWKNLLLEGYKPLFRTAEWNALFVANGYASGTIEPETVFDRVMKYGGSLKEFITDTGAYLDNALKLKKNVMFEAQLGALRDIDFGIFPYTSSSSTIAAYAPSGAGIPRAKLDGVIGIVKAYSSCVGEGPFVVEMSGLEADMLREAGGEYGAATGRPRRVGAFDAVASSYGVKIQGATALALTKLDVLSYMEKIPVCTAYEVDGERCSEFMTDERLLRAKPVIEYMDGFKRDISKCRKKSDLPANALKYIEYAEKTLGTGIKYVSVGQAREDFVLMY